MRESIPVSAGHVPGALEAGRSVVSRGSGADPGVGVLLLEQADPELRAEEMNVIVEQTVARWH